MKKDQVIEKEKEYHCSFCGIAEEEADMFIGDDNNTAFICLNCVNAIHEMSNQYKDIEIAIDTRKNAISLETNVEEAPSFIINEKKLNPKDIKVALDEYVIGQPEAKEIVSIAAYNHYKRVEYNLNKEQTDIELDKSNILFVGPSGSGKTLIVETLAKILNVPFILADATTLTETGYVGNDVEDILLRLIESADNNISKAEQGIIFIDEIDKISSKNVEGRNNTRDVAGEGVQQALLKIVEGKEVSIKIPNTENTVSINTKNILFIAAGAFIGIEEINNNRFKKKTMGFKEQKMHIVKNKLSENSNFSALDLIEYGLIPELIGRFPVISKLEKLSNEQLLEILTIPKNSLTKQFQLLFKLDDIDLQFEDKALNKIIEITNNFNLGARGLRSILDKTLQKFMFNLEDYKHKTVIIEEKDINDTELNNNQQQVI